MTRIVVVHGINNTYLGPESMANEWIGPLVDGVHLAEYPSLITAEDITCAFYGDLFRGTGRFLGHEDLAALSPDDIEVPAEVEVLQQWWAEASRTDSAVMPPGTWTLGPIGGVKAALAALAGSRFLAGLTEQVFLLWLKQVRAYFTRPELRGQIHERFAESITSDTRVVIAHSLGSVVAYEALCANPQWPVEALVTLGSPLAIRHIVFDRLEPAPRMREGELRGSWPGGVRRWTNISDRADFVALERKLHLRFAPEVIDVEIDNGARFHDVTRYLTEKSTGKAIGEALTVMGSRWGAGPHG